MTTFKIVFTFDVFLVLKPHALLMTCILYKKQAHFSQRKKIQKGYIKLNYVVCLSDTGSSCHVTVMGSLIVLVNKRAD
jgi:hypothetical protein